MSKSTLLRILVFSDLQAHPWQENERSDRWTRDYSRVFDLLDAAASKYAVDYTVFNGDLFEAKRNIRSDVLSFVFSRLISNGIGGRRVVYNAGNHDYYKATCVLDVLQKSKHTLAVNHKYTDKRGVLMLTSDQGVSVLFVANGADVETRDVLGDDFTIAFMHDDLAGAAMTATQQADNDALGSELFKRCGSRRVVINGHYHIPQVVQRAGQLPVYICGAPMAFNWGDVDDDTQRGAMLLTVNADRTLSIKRIPFTGLPRFYSSADKACAGLDFVKPSIVYTDGDISDSAVAHRSNDIICSGSFDESLREYLSVANSITGERLTRLVKKGAALLNSDQQ